eukprot:PhF_6_TR2168/c1_g1_i1/m.3539
MAVTSLSMTSSCPLSLRTAPAPCPSGSAPSGPAHPTVPADPRPAASPHPLQQPSPYPHGSIRALLGGRPFPPALRTITFRCGGASSCAARRPSSTNRIITIWSVISASVMGMWFLSHSSMISFFNRRCWAIVSTGILLFSKIL